MGNPPFLVMLTWGSWDIHRKLQGFSHPPYQAAVASGLATLAGQKKPQAVAAIGAMAVAEKLDPLVGQNTGLSTNPTKNGT